MRAVLFDMWETLATGSWSAINEQLAVVAGVDVERMSQGIAATVNDRHEGLYPDAVACMETVLRAAGVVPSTQLVEDLVATQRGLEETHVHLFGDSIEILEKLRQEGIKTAIVSNCDPMTRPIIERLGLDQVTDALVLSCEVGVVKPDAGIFELAVSLLGVPKEEVLFVDDQPGFCDGAAGIGLSTRVIDRSGAKNSTARTDSHGHVFIADLYPLLP